MSQYKTPKQIRQASNNPWSEPAPKPLSAQPSASKAPTLRNDQSEYIVTLLRQRLWDLAVHIQQAKSDARAGDRWPSSYIDDLDLQADRVRAILRAMNVDIAEEEERIREHCEELDSEP
jgi:hypothetical protein